MTSKHYNNDRATREATIQRIGEGKPFAEFIVDKGHINGPERHIITTNGIIIIRNLRTNKLITKLIARPNQITRYYDDEKDYPTEIINIALKHMMAKLNK